MIKPVQKNKYKYSLAGFTLVELLVVIAIIGILSAIGIVSFASSQMRARDAQRKSDLKQVANALELFYSDYETYPRDDGEGKMKACPFVSGDSAKTLACVWGTSGFRDEDASSNVKTTYFIELPDSPRGESYYYVYDSANNAYKLYTVLENDQDPSIGSYMVNGVSYNFAVTSTNTTP